MLLSPLQFFLSLFGVGGSGGSGSQNESIQSGQAGQSGQCPAYIRHVGTGLSRTGTQTLTHKLVDESNGDGGNRVNVYNSMRQMQLGHLDMVRASVPCDGMTESFKTWYYNVLASSTTPVLASIDVPLNFCYREIAELQMEAGFKNFSLQMTHRRPDEWVNSFKHLLAAFAPIAGFPYSLFVGDMVTHTAEQFRHHLNCSIQQTSLLGFTVAAWMEDPLACHNGFIRWNLDVLDFASTNNLQLMNHTIGSPGVSTTSFGVSSNELLFLAFVSRLPAIVCLMLLTFALELWFEIQMGNRIANRI